MEEFGSAVLWARELRPSVGLRERRRAQDLPLQIIATHALCSETDAEAEAYDRYAVDRADTTAVDALMNFARGETAGGRRPDIQRTQTRRSQLTIGSPARVADELVRLSTLCANGATLSFVNFQNELPFVIDRILLLRAACLRNS